MGQIGMVTAYSQPRRGFLFKPTVLNRVAPLFFTPRGWQGIRLKEVGLEASGLIIPLGIENWNSLTPEVREHFEKRILVWCRKHEIGSLGVNRGLNGEGFDPVAIGKRGDLFIMALALLRVAESLGRYGGRRVILVSDQGLAFSLAVKVTERFKVPVVLQSIRPIRHEAAAWHMFRQEGLAMSLSTLNPAKWRADDIVLCLDESYANMVAEARSGRRFNLADSSRGHAPSLEEELRRQGMDPALRNLAPLMEAYLLPEPEVKDSLSLMEERGEPLWGHFLDKGGNGHYNTIKGF